MIFCGSCWAMIRDEVKSNTHTHTRPKSAYILFSVNSYWSRHGGERCIFGIEIRLTNSLKTWLNRKFENWSTFFWDFFFFLFFCFFLVLIYLFLSVCTVERGWVFCYLISISTISLFSFQNQPTSLLFIPFSSSIFPSSFTDFFPFFFSRLLLEVIPNRWLILPNGSGIITHKTQ